MDALFESHAHYDDEAFDSDRDEILSELTRLPRPVTVVINAGADVESSKKGAELASKYKHVYSAAGVHPHDAENIDEEAFDTIRSLCRLEKTIAIGETGLDYYRDLSPRDLQKKWFAEHIELAVCEKLPIIVHSRDADYETLNIIKKSDAKRVGGVIHCFSGSAELAEEYVRLGFYIGVGGVVTYKNARKLLETVERIPLERILIETDCPYLTPEPFRGRRNDSRNLKYIISKIAEIKCVDVEEAARATFENGIRLFGIKV